MVDQNGVFVQKVAFLCVIPDGRTGGHHLFDDALVFLLRHNSVVINLEVAFEPGFGLVVDIVLCFFGLLQLLEVFGGEVGIWGLFLPKLYAHLKKLSNGLLHSRLLAKTG